MNKLYIAGTDEIPMHVTLADNDVLHATIICPPGYSGDVNFRIDLLRPGVELDLAGLSFCPDGEKQTLKVEVRHEVGGAVSNQIFKSIVGKGGKAFFDGMIYVAHGADKTKALQESHSLLLSEGASAETHPQLEIYADDVECSHGATVGFLNEEELFYMRSRGIPEDEAKRLQVLSFLAPVLKRLPEEVKQSIISKL